MIEHCRCNKQVRDRVCAKPGLVGGQPIRLEKDLYWLVGDFTNAQIFRIRPLGNFPLTWVCYTSAVFHVRGVEAHIDTPRERCHRVNSGELWGAW